MGSPNPNESQRPPLDEVEVLRAALAEKVAEIAKKNAVIARLERHVELYRKLAFGASSEKRTPSTVAVDPRQGHLFAALLSEAEQVARATGAEGEVEQLDGGRPKKRARRRAKFPAHAPRFRTTYELPESERVCSCGETLREIGVAVSTELERIEVTIVHEIARKKYACASCFGTAKTAPGPARVIEGGLLGPGFLAHVITERFLNHMPYYRQEQKYASEGLSVRRTVLERSSASGASILVPVYDQLRKDALSKDVLFTDDTPVRVAESSSGKPATGRIWTYCDLEGRVVYDFTESRKRDGPMRVLGDYRGFIHADAYPGYDALYLPSGAREVACMAHARRKVLAAEKQEPDLVEAGIRIIRALYRVEAAAITLELPFDERRALRDERSRPLFQELESWLDRVEMEALPQGALREAARYMRNQWSALQTYLEDGRLEIDNNRAERALRPFAVGRKNWLFFQTPGGGRNAAILMSLVRTAKEIGLDPKVYLRDVLVRIAFESDVRKLTPHGWKEHFAGQVTRQLHDNFRVALEPAPPSARATASP